MGKSNHPYHSDTEDAEIRIGRAHGGRYGVDPVSQPQIHFLLALDNKFHLYQDRRTISQGLFGPNHLYFVTSTSSIYF